jgi:hypothetical protein
MKKNLFHRIYQFRHIIALVCTIVVFFIIKKITIVLFINPPQYMSVFTLIERLWESKQLFLRFIIIMNFVIKPLFFYYIILMAFYCIKWSKSLKR